MEFEWDDEKAATNQHKHGVSFDEAQELFTSRNDYLELYDENHSTYEDRFIAIGPIQRGLVLIVWTERVNAVVRIISARWATKREQDMYRSYTEENQ